jgi:hypothetical protein
MGLPPVKIFFLLFFRQLNLQYGGFLAFLLKRVGQYDQILAAKETKEPESVFPDINSDFPNIVGIYQFLKLF